MNSRKNLPVTYSPDDYDRYTDQFLAPYDQALMKRVAEVYRESGGGRQILVDVGSGTARIPVKLCADPALSELHILATDYFDEMVEKARKVVAAEGLQERIEVCKEDVHAMSFQDNFCHLAMSRSTIHHWERPGQAFREIHRILRPGGSALIHDIRRDPPREIVEAFQATRVEAAVKPSNFEEKYTPTEVEQFLREAGIFDCSIVTAPERGPGALGFEVWIRKQ